MGLGGVLFAGALEDENYFGAAGIVPGIVCALLGFVAARAFLGGAADRLAARGESGGTISALGDFGAVAIAALAVLLPPAVVRRGRVLPLGAARAPAARRDRSTKASTQSSIATVTHDDKLVLVMVDALKPAMLERAVAEGRAPAFAEILRRGTYFPDCVSVFPSVTPAAAGSITTGTMPDAHGVPSICWYHRGERRYVDYGSSGAAVRTFGVLRALTDTVYNMNFDHLQRRTLTVFERLDDMGVRTACTPFLIFRGRTRHELGVQGLLRRVAQAANFRHPVYGPSELFYGELYSSQVRRLSARRSRGPARATRTPVASARTSSEHDLYDFMLFSLPDNDHHSHRFGPQATVESIARADRHLAELAEPAGGIERFLDDHAVILMSDHAQIAVSERIQPRRRRCRTGGCCSRTTPALDGAELAVAPGARSAMVYVIDPESFRRARLRASAEAHAGASRASRCWLGRRARRPACGPRAASCDSAPATRVRDLRGGRWDVEGDPATLELEERDGMLASRTYPGCAAAGSGRRSGCEGAGDVLVSAARGYEFTDWGGADHVGGGSHGSLRHGDSLADARVRQLRARPRRRRARLAGAVVDRRRRADRGVPLRASPLMRKRARSCAATSRACSSATRSGAARTRRCRRVGPQQRRRERRGRVRRRPRKRSESCSTTAATGPRGRAG